MSSRPDAESAPEPDAAPPAVDAAREAMRSFGLSLPETREDFPWGEPALKVRKKVFVFMGHGGADLGFSVKLPQSGSDVLCMPFASPTGYGLGRSGWVSFRFSAEALPDTQDLVEWVEESYRAIAPKTLVKALDRQRAQG